MRDVGIGSWIAGRVGSAPRKVALVHGERSWTYGDLGDRTARLANGLASLGVERGDRVAWLGPNHPAFLETLFAAARLGAVTVPLNHRLEAEDLASVLEDSGAGALVFHDAVEGAIPPNAPSARVRAAGPGAEASGEIAFEALLAASSPQPPAVPVGLEDLCMLPYTSGTTGRPKGVMLTHGNVTWNVVNFLSCVDFASDDVTLAIAPFFRVGGTGVNVLPVLFKGGTVVVVDTFEADTVLELIQRHRVTLGFGGPELLEALPRSPGWNDADLSSVRLFVTGGAPVPERMVSAYRDRGFPLLPGYGLSEAGPLALLLDPADAVRKAGSAGKPPVFVDIRVVDPELEDVPQGSVGELLVRGPAVMAGYWNRPDATAATITEDGWLRTGDAVRLDDEGFVWIVDRVADGYRSGGELVYPGEIEQVLLRHPSVREAAAVGVPDEAIGAAGAAFVVPERPGLGEDELLAFCREHLPEERVPRSVRIVEALPRNPAGKVLRRRLREIAVGAGSRPER